MFYNVKPSYILDFNTGMCDCIVSYKWSSSCRTLEDAKTKMAVTRLMISGYGHLLEYSIDCLP